MRGTFLYAYLGPSGARERVYPTLGGALFAAVMDLHAHRATPVAVRLGARVLFDADALTALWQTHRAALDRSQHPAVTVALDAVAAAALAT